MGITSSNLARSLVGAALAAPCLLGAISTGSPAAASADSADAHDVVVTADTCSASDVQAALLAAPDGSTVTIPAGDCDWGAAKVFRNAGVTIEGAGIGSTTIRRTAPMPAGDNALLMIDCGNGKTVEISGLNVVGNDLLQSAAQRRNDYDDGIVLEGGCVDFTVHDVAFSRFSHAGLWLAGGGERGVVYDSSFISNFKCQKKHPVDCLGYGVLVTGDFGAERPPVELGSENAVFVEDSYFKDNRHAIASSFGSRYVARHDEFVDSRRARNYGTLDAHGRTDSAVGSTSWEIYDNTFTTKKPSIITAGIVIRGGDGVIYDNDFTRTSAVLHLTIEGGCVDAPPYPVAEQTRAAYVWDNAWSAPPGYPTDPVQLAPECENYFQLGRDYYDHAPDGYVAYPYPHPLR